MISRLRLHTSLLRSQAPTFPTTTRNTRTIETATMTTPTISGDASLGPVFFWREFEEPYGFMSQWYDSTFEVDGVTYLSTEMWMMIQKAKLFGDEVCLR